jgi:hypothetical protein
MTLPRPSGCFRRLHAEAELPSDGLWACRSAKMRQAHNEPIGRAFLRNCKVHVADRFYDAKAEYNYERNGDDHEGQPPPYDEHDRQGDQDRDEVGVLRGSL